MSFKQQLKAIFGVAKLSFQTAPGAVFFKLAGSVVSAVVPFIATYYAALTTTALAQAYAGDAAAGDRAILYVCIAAALGLFMTIWSSIDKYIQAQMRFVVEAKVADRMYEHFLELPFMSYDDKHTADLYDKAQRFASFFSYIFDRIAALITQLITMVAGVAALFTMNAWLAIIVFMAIVPGVYIQFKLSRAQIAHWNKNVDVRRIQGRIEWSLLQPAIISELRLYGVVRHLMELRSKMRQKDEKQRIDFEKQYLAKRLMADGLEAATEVGALIWVVFQIISRAVPIGQFVFVQQVISRAMGGASGFISQLSTIDEDIANLVDYELFMNLPKGNVGSSSMKSIPQSMQFQDVSFAYPSRPEHLVLKNISLNIRHGDHIAIVGENGAGKSTLVKLITGLYFATAGRVLIDNKDIRDYDIGDWHQKLSVLQQDSVRYTFANVRENVEFGALDKAAKTSRVRDALQKAEAAEFVDELPRKLNNYVDNWMEDSEGNKGVDLSGGQWQRLALARNFYRDAPIVILDEPTSAIDALAESRIFERLFKEKDRTIITISHRLTTVQKADVIYMLEDGEIVEFGSHKDLLWKKGRYYRMFHSQLHESELES